MQGLKPLSVFWSQYSGSEFQGSSLSHPPKPWERAVVWVSDLLDGIPWDTGYFPMRKSVCSFPKRANRCWTAKNEMSSAVRHLQRKNPGA